MATVQTSIPFKSKKLRYGSKVTAKANNESRETKRTKKRSHADYAESSSCSEQECSPTKKPRIQKNRTRNKSLNCERDSELLEELPSREKELQTLEEFLRTHLEKGTSGSLYVSGQPGTGKTACLSYILQRPQFQEGYKSVYVNCTMIKSAGNIYQRICTELHLPTTGSTEKACLAAIEKYLNKKHKMVLLVLDEIDQLESKKQCVLYTIFEWASRPHTKLVLVGVANALDLTERTLPRLQARNLRPQLMHFPPYTKEQIVNIFTRTIAARRDADLFSPVALQMLAAKISAVSGDMRRALDIGRRVVELARRNKFSETGDVTALMNDRTATVELKQVVAVLSDVYGTSQKLGADVQDESFPLQQKLLICSLMLMLTKGKSKEIVVGRLYDVYKRVARRRNIAAVGSGEFYSLCSLVETRGMIRVWGRGEPRARRLALQWDQAEVEAALRDKTLISDILNDLSCLAPR